MEVKYCPQCGKLSEPDQAVCDCGYSVAAKTRVRHEIPPYQPIGSPPRYNRGRLRILGACLAVVISAVGVLAFFNLSGASSDDKDTEETVAPKPQLTTKTGLVGKSDVTGEFEGVVTRIVTGDAIAVRDMRNTEHLVRLLDIVAPKLDDPFGKESQESLSAVVLGKTVRVHPLRNESGVVYGRVTKDGTNVGLEQVRSGFAAQNSHLELVESDRKLYADAEVSARKARLGVWGSSGPPALPPAPNLASVADPTVISRGPSAFPASDSGQPAAPTPGSSETTNQGLEQREAVKVPAAPTSRPVEDAPPPPPLIETARETATATVPSSSEAPARSREQPATVKSSTQADAPSGRKYTLGPRGGCYYLNSRGSKSYVDRSLCQ